MNDHIRPKADIHYHCYRNTFDTLFNAVCEILGDIMEPDEGLITAYVIDSTGKGSALDWEGIHNWKPEQGLLWVHLDYQQDISQKWLDEASGLDPIVIEALSAEETRPRYAIIDNGLLTILRGVNLNPGADPEDMISIRLWLDKNRIISTRSRYMLSEKKMITAIEAGKGPQTSSEFLTDHSYYMIEHMSDVIDDIDNKVDRQEDLLEENEVIQIQDELADMRKQIITLRRYLAPQRDLMLRLASEKLVWFEEHDRLHLREIADTIMRYIEELDEARERIKVIHEQIISSISDQTNKRMYLLSIIAAIFLPLSFIVGLLGINVKMPGADHPDAFIIVTLLLVALSVALYFILKIKKWM